MSNPPDYANGAIASILRQMAEQQAINHAENKALIEDFKKAFPGGDMEGHCNHHQMQIDRSRLFNEILRETIKHLAKYGLIGMLGWLGWLMLTSGKTWLMTK